MYRKLRNKLLSCDDKDLIIMQLIIWIMIFCFGIILSFFLLPSEQLELNISIIVVLFLALYFCASYLTGKIEKMYRKLNLEVVEENLRKGGYEISEFRSTYPQHRILVHKKEEKSQKKIYLIMNGFIPLIRKGLGKITGELGLLKEDAFLESLRKASCKIDIVFHDENLLTYVEKGDINKIDQRMEELLNSRDKWIKVRELISSKQIDIYLSRQKVEPHITFFDDWALYVEEVHPHTKPPKLRRGWLIFNPIFMSEIYQRFNQIKKQSILLSPLLIKMHILKQTSDIKDLCIKYAELWPQKVSEIIRSERQELEKILFDVIELSKVQDPETSQKAQDWYNKLIRGLDVTADIAQLVSFIAGIPSLPAFLGSQTAVHATEFIRNILSRLRKSI